PPLEPPKLQVFQTFAGSYPHPCPQRATAPEYTKPPAGSLPAGGLVLAVVYVCVPAFIAAAPLSCAAACTPAKTRGKMSLSPSPLCAAGSNLNPGCLSEARQGPDPTRSLSP